METLPSLDCSIQSIGYPLASLVLRILHELDNMLSLPSFYWLFTVQLGTTETSFQAAINLSAPDIFGNVC